MNDLWQQAQEAVANGNHEQAHLLLANLLRQDRDNVAAWYLLSTIVPSEEQEEVFLKRVLKLTPDHPEALGRLAILQGTQPAPPPELPTVEHEVARQAESQPEEVPAWLMEDDGLAETKPDEASAIFAEEMGDIPEEEIPDWLRDMPPGDWASDEMQALAPASAEPDTTVAPSLTTQRRPPRARPTPLLMGLVAAAAIVFVVLLYVILTLGPSLFA